MNKFGSLQLASADLQLFVTSRGDKWVRTSLIGGLNDEDTNQAVLSNTITFVEARETGKTSMKILAGKLSSGQ